VSEYTATRYSELKTEIEQLEVEVEQLEPKNAADGGETVLPL